MMNNKSFFKSYAGKYVPALGYYIHILNPTANVKINFKGIAIGDGLCDPEMMVGGYPDFLYQIGMVDENQRLFLQEQTDLAIKYIQEEKWIAAFEEPLDQEYFGSFLSLSEVRKSIHVGNLTFHDGSEVEKHLLSDVMKTVKPWLAVLMDNYRVLIYSGQLDIIVAAPLTERFLPTVPWSKVEEYKKAERIVWKVTPADTEVAGYVRVAGEFSQVIVRGGGHILPYDQPERSYAMIDRFIRKCKDLNC
ncbi:hypothetical protein GDO86_011689 [Hymenochirus boettgeri]|uniref:Serine carboxypeptidase CPVL n=1 Tax=Hymenochirus boettgeri TaxID=247094 RepID=A0A8T2JHB8_9PIPI|nr:hypothetical protein GDO86_011689 [Hymenochirus boettgeri]